MSSPKDTESKELQDSLKSTLWYHVGKIVDEETINLGINATPQFIGSLMELTWAQIVNAGTDIESFANHAGRNTVQTKDVVLLGRRNEGVEQILTNHVEKLKKQNEEEKRRKKE